MYYVDTTEKRSKKWNVRILQFSDHNIKKEGDVREEYNLLLTLRKTTLFVFSWESAASRLIAEGGIQRRSVDKG